jgi:bacillithiol biosynthesis cysteine-adding enzyme BshC
MQPACIRQNELPGTSKLFADFTHHFDRVAQFYRHDPGDPASFARAAAEIDYPDSRRAALVEALAAQNGPSETLAKLAQPGTMAIVTGQQVGLFSGPAYTIYKALTAARVALQVTAAGLPAVPVFWLATEDHDFAEVNHAWMFSATGEHGLVHIDAPTENGGRQRPVGGIAIAQPPLDELRRLLQGFPYADEVLAAVAAAYPPGVTMGGGFRALLKKLLSKLDLIFIDPLDPAIRKIGAPLLAQALSLAPELKARLLERNLELAAAGYHAQVHIEPKSSLFFLLQNGERVQLRRKDAEYAGLAGRATEISPNALLRPVFEDYLLPTMAYIGGPGELAYLAQSQVIYDRLLGRMPVAMSRSGFTLLDARSAKLLERYRLTAAQTLVPEEVLRERIARALVPERIEKSIATATAEITAKLDHLRADLEVFDPTLAAALDKSRAKIVYQIEKMRRKTEREALRRDQRATSDAHHLSTMLYPHRHLQERFYSILPFLAQHGLGLVDRLYEAVELDCPDHRIYTI